MCLKPEPQALLLEADIQIHLEETVRSDIKMRRTRDAATGRLSALHGQAWAPALALGKIAEYSGVYLGFHKQRAEMGRLKVQDRPGLHSETQLKTKSRTEVIQRKTGTCMDMLHNLVSTNLMRLEKSCNVMPPKVFHFNIP